jgi:hypothetical protein
LALKRKKAKSYLSRESNGVEGVKGDAKLGLSGSTVLESQSGGSLVNRLHSRNTTSKGSGHLFVFEERLRGERKKIVNKLFGAGANSRATRFGLVNEMAR